MGTVTDADEAWLVKLLSSDVETTIGPGHDARIQRVAAHVRGLRTEIDDYVAMVVEDVQQEFHDLFIDTSWPSCPFHRNHPLWLHGQHWVCAQNRIPVAPLGRLR